MRNWVLPKLKSLFIYLVLISPYLAVALASRQELLERSDFSAKKRSVQVAIPNDPPTADQESILIALEIFAIQVPAGVKVVAYDPLLIDRGLTSRQGFFSSASVYVGPSAFTSWAMLGSTLAHELEIHCQQNFFTIFMLDNLGLDGTGAAERQAYLHELANGERFGFSPVDEALVRETLDYFYPLPSGRSSRSTWFALKSWLARVVI